MRGKIRTRANDQRGQAILEYILLLLVISGVAYGVSAYLRRANITQAVTKPIREDFARAYKYGHSKAKGYDEGAPIKHVRIEDDGNFRLYIKPR